MYKAFFFSFVFMVSFCSSLLACGGDCLECHEKLKPLIHDENHMILKTCVTCHTTNSPRGQCGQDCFACHSKVKFYSYTDVVEHQAIRKCSKCHEEKADFTLPKHSIVPTQQNLIQSFQ